MPSSDSRRIVKAPLSALPGKLHAVRFRKNRECGPLVVQFECGGTVYETVLTSPALCQNIIGEMWLHSHSEAQAERRRKRREKYRRENPNAALRKAAKRYKDRRPTLAQHCDTAARVVKTWPDWKKNLLGGKGTPA